MDLKTKEVLDALFEFELGEIVYFRSAKDTIIGVDRPNGYVIVERRLHQCLGGLQQSYVIGGKSVHEIELTRDRPASRKMTETEVEGRSLVDQLHRRASWSAFSASMDAPRKAKDDAEGTS